MVTARAESAPKPDFGTAGANWSQEGWFVPVEYVFLDNQIRPKDHIAILRLFLPSKYSPLQATGDGLQSVYLVEVPQPLADALSGLIGQPYWDAYAVLAASQNTAAASDEENARRLVRALTHAYTTEVRVQPNPVERASRKVSVRHDLNHPARRNQGPRDFQD